MNDERQLTDENAFRIRLSEETREMACEQGGVRLSQEQWDEIEIAFSNLQVWRRHEKTFRNTKAIAKLLSNVRGAVGGLDQAIKELSCPPLTAEKDEARLELNACLRRYGFTLEDVSGVLRYLRIAAKHAEANTAEKSVLKPGPPTSDAERNFVGRVGLVYEAAGGIAAANFSPNRRQGEEIVGPFIRFLYTITRALPVGYQLAESPEKLGYRVRTYLRRERDADA